MTEKLPAEFKEKMLNLIPIGRMGTDNEIATGVRSGLGRSSVYHWTRPQHQRRDVHGVKTTGGSWKVAKNVSAFRDVPNTPRVLWMLVLSLVTCYISLLE